MAKKCVSNDAERKHKVSKDARKALKDYESGKSKLNDLFKSIKGKSSATAASSAEPVAAAGKAAPKKKAVSSGGSLSSGGYKEVSVSGAARKRTDDNLPIYTLEELNVGKGGGTDLCPFDCSCCY